MPDYAAEPETGLRPLHLAIELFADSTHLVFADAIQAERLGEGVDVAGADPVHVGFLDHRQQPELVPKKLRIRPCSSLRSRSKSAILKLVIVVVLQVVG